MSAQKILWDHLITMISFLILVGSPSLADPIPAVQDPSISIDGIGLSDPRIKRSPDWKLGVPDFGWLSGFFATEKPATQENLAIAAEEGNLENVKDFIARGVEVNYRHGVPLAKAAENGHLEVVKYLLEAGANPNGTKYSGVPLAKAAENGHMEVVKYLLEAGANPNGNNGYSNYKGLVLQKAAGNNHLDIVNVLLEAGATVKTEIFYGVGVMDKAAYNGHLAVIQRLLEAGADPDYGRGYTLSLAAQEGHLDVVNAFIDAGADVNIGWLLANTAERGHLEVVKALIKVGANDYGYAMESAAKNGHLDIVKLMLENGADPSYGHVLKSAAEFGDLEVVRALLEAGSNITYDGAREDGNGSPLHFAALKGHPEVVALLVEYGADINRPLAKDYWWDYSTGHLEYYGNGWTVMHVAARWGQIMIQKLMALGADINVQDVRGRTPLQVAVLYNRIFFVKEMLRFCADLTPTNSKGKTALDLGKAEASRNATYSPNSQNLINILTKVLPEKIASSTYNVQNIDALREEFKTMMEASSTLKEQLIDVYTSNADINTAIHYIFEERGRQGVTKVLEDHNCQMSLLEKGTIAIGYLARCECVPGQGPTMTVTEDGNLCDQRAIVQKE